MTLMVGSSLFTYVRIRRIRLGGPQPWRDLGVTPISHGLAAQPILGTFGSKLSHLVDAALSCVVYSGPIKRLSTFLIAERQLK